MPVNLVAPAATALLSVMSVWDAVSVPVSGMLAVSPSGLSLSLLSPPRISMTGALAEVTECTSSLTQSRRGCGSLRAVHVQDTRVIDIYFFN
jgi:hypothetical protein